jgi:serine/threonine protein kinase
MSRAILPGDKIAGKYRVLRPLGEGGMGSVYLAEHERLNRQVAIKVLHSHLAEGELAVARFEREIKVMARVRNGHVAEALDADVLDDGSLFLVMEYLDGRDLRAELKLRSAIPYPEAVAYIVQACEGVAAVHETGVIHRDLKPSNLFVTNLTGARQIKVLDFGVAKVLAGSEASLTATDSTVGTPLYMSPEQLVNPNAISERADVWALGAVLYTLIAGVSPFAANSPGAVVAAIMYDDAPRLSRLVPEVPDALAEILVDTLEKSPARRIGSARELGRRLARFAMPNDLIVVATPTTSRPPPVMPKRRSIHPELSARVASEVDRQSVKFPIGSRDDVTKSDQLRRIPNLGLLNAATEPALPVPLLAPSESPPSVAPSSSSTRPPPRALFLAAGALVLMSSVGVIASVLKPGEPDSRAMVSVPKSIQAAATLPSGSAAGLSSLESGPASSISQPALPIAPPSPLLSTSSSPSAPAPRSVSRRRPLVAASAPPPTSPSPYPTAADGKPLHL